MPYLKLSYFPPCCRLKFASLLSALSSSSSTPTPLCYLLPIPTLFGCIIPFYNQLLVILHFSAFSSPFNPHPSSFFFYSLSFLCSCCLSHHGTHMSSFSLSSTKTTHFPTLVLVGAHLDWSSLFFTFLTPPLSSFLLPDSLPPFASPNPMLQHKLPYSDTANQTLQDRTLPSCPASTKSPLLWSPEYIVSSLRLSIIHSKLPSLQSNTGWEEPMMMMRKLVRTMTGWSPLMVILIIKSGQLSYDSKLWLWWKMWFWEIIMTIKNTIILRTVMMTKMAVTKGRRNSATNKCTFYG